MATRSVRIASPHGLHARPAALFVKAATACGIPVTISANGRDPVNAASMLSVLTLNAAQGDEVVLHADGDDAEAALDGLVSLLLDSGS